MSDGSHKPALHRFDYVEGDATAAYGGKLSRSVRRVLHLRPGAFLICDELRSPVPRRFEWRLHTLEQMAIDAGAGVVTVKRGQARLRVVFLAPAGLSLEQTSEIRWPPEDKKPPQWHLTATVRDKRTRCRFLVALIPYRAGEEASLPTVGMERIDRAFGVSVTRPGQEFLALFQEPENLSRVTYRGLETTGPVGAGWRATGTLLCFSPTGDSVGITEKEDP